MTSTELIALLCEAKQELAVAQFALLHGDCIEQLREIPDASVDSVVTDPPAGIAFMGKAWDEDKGGRRQWIAWMVEVMGECLRVLKPGGHALVWALPRTSHWTATALEDAGFEVRNCLVHVFGSGFPKNMDVSKAMDKAAGAEREVVGEQKLTGNARKSTTHTGHGAARGNSADPREYIESFYQITAPATDLAKQWTGWGTALKPASEHWWLVRKPLVGTVAAKVEGYGTGALNIDASRVGTSKRVPSYPKTAPSSAHTVSLKGYAGGSGYDANVGRWPPNFLLSHTEDCAEGACADDCAVSEMDRQSGTTKSRIGKPRGSATSGDGRGMTATGAKYKDSGGASRFFPVFRYQAKPAKSEKGATNVHPTVKSIALMDWLIRLVTPPGGVVLDPFMGSGTTGVAAVQEGFRFIGVERESESFAIAEARIEGATRG